MGLRYDLTRSDSFASLWELKRVDKREYDLSEKHPLRVTTQPHMTLSGESFNVHYALELGVVTSGSMTRVYRDHRRQLAPGDVWLSGPWEPHGFELADGACSAVVASIFPPMLATSMFPELPSFDWLGPFMMAPERRPSVPADERATVLSLARELARSEVIPEPRCWLVQRLLVYQILLLLPRVESPESEAPALLADEYARVHAAIDLVLRSKRHVKSSEAAQVCGMTVRTFSRLFPRAAGVSFHVFSARRRLQGAALQLLESPDPIKAIAHAWGFFDASHFHQAFRAAYGCSPASFRRTGHL